VCFHEEQCHGGTFLDDGGILRWHFVHSLVYLLHVLSQVRFDLFFSLEHV